MSTKISRRKLTGPYELHPDTYIMSARHRPDAELQRAGHASLVETQNGEADGYMDTLKTLGGVLSVELRGAYQRW